MEVGFYKAAIYFTQSAFWKKLFRVLHNSQSTRDFGTQTFDMIFPGEIFVLDHDQVLSLIHDLDLLSTYGKIRGSRVMIIDLFQVWSGTNYHCLNFYYIKGKFFHFDCNEPSKAFVWKFLRILRRKLLTTDWESVRKV